MSIFRLLGRAAWGVSPSVVHGGEGISAEKKKEIDDLRSTAIRRHLNKFTVTLNETDISHEQPATMQQSSAKCCLQTSNNSTTEEEGQKIGIDEESADDKADGIGSEQCTLLSIPLAHGIDSSSVMTNARAGSIKSSQRYCVKLKGLNDQDHRRDAFIDECAICHEEYKLTEKICYSSNSKCTHVFHEHCIADWLVSLGWMKLKEQKVHESLMDEQKLLNYDLDCPCCRQHFIDKSLFVDVGGEDNV